MAEEQLIKWLRETYVVHPNSSISSKTIEKTASLHQLPVGEACKRLWTVIPKAFQDIKIQKSCDPSIVRGLASREKYLDALDAINQKIETSEQHVQQSLEKRTQEVKPDDREKETEKGQTGCDMNNWTVWDVCVWLGESSLDRSVKSVAMEVFVKQDINGHVLKNMKMGDFAPEFFKPMTYGLLFTILSERDKYLAENQHLDSKHLKCERPNQSSKDSDSIQSFRKFGEDETSTYIPGAKFDLSGGGRDGDLLLPKHCFIDVAKSGSATQELVTTALQFAVACLNDRQNGTVHFGVDEAGRIIGMREEIKDFNACLQQQLEDKFSPDLSEMALYCVKPLRKIALSTGATVDTRHVYEVDVIPSARICGKEIFVLCDGSNCRELLRLREGIPSVLSQEATDEFSSEVAGLYDLRQMQELNLSGEIDRPYWINRYTQLIYKGDTTMKSDQYPLLVLGPPPADADETYFKDLSFIKDIRWKAVLDFDPSRKLLDYLDNKEQQNIRVLLLDEFDPKNSSKQKEMKEEIKASKLLPWILANSPRCDDEEQAKCVFDWKQQNFDAYSEVLQFLSSIMQKERAVLVLVVQSDDTATIADATYDLLLRFPNHLAILSDNVVAANSLTSKLGGRLGREEKEFRSSVAAGISWSTVNAVLREVCKPHIGYPSQIPSSTGIPYNLTYSSRNKYVDLEIIGMNECAIEAEARKKSGSLKQWEKEVEEAFYRGEEATWWNFYFKKQVINRNILETLHQDVKDAIKGIQHTQDDIRVARVTLYHEPGAGGTTVAKHILWKMRKIYRCAVVNAISQDERETATQILEFRKVGEKETPGPVIVLLDNPDDEKLANLTLLVEQKAKLEERNNEYRQREAQVACVFLVCVRATEAPQYQVNPYSELKLKLARNEMREFQTTYQRLEQQHKDLEGQDPSTLIAINIMKSGFNKEHIKATVTRLVNSIECAEEKLLLKYISFLNVFDLNHTPVPTGAFHYMMQYNSNRRKYSPRNWGYGGMISREQFWELSLSHPMTLLLNHTIVPQFSYTKAIGIIHPLLSAELLRQLGLSSNQTDSDVAVEIMNRNDLFSTGSYAEGHLRRYLKDILIKRRRALEGMLDKFSPLIMKVREKESVEKALEVYQNGFELLDDAFVAQQISRFYITLQNWPLAEMYIKTAIEKYPGNSYFLDTYARIYLSQLENKKEELERIQILSQEEELEVFRIAQFGIHLRHQEQELSKEEGKVRRLNDAGYYGEIQGFLELLKCLKFSKPFLGLHKTEFEDKIRALFRGEEEILDDLRNWGHDENQQYYPEVLQKMGKDVLWALNFLGDKNMQLRASYQDDFMYTQRKSDSKSLSSCKAELDCYFGDFDEKDFSNLTEEQACAYRREIVFAHGGNSFDSVYSLRDTNTGRKKLVRLFDYLKKNIETTCWNVDDYRMLMNVTFTSLSTEVIPHPDCTIEGLAEWSTILYSKRGNLEFQSQEPYMFYTMLNWPGRSNETTVSPTEITEALKQWRKSYFDRFPYQKGDQVHKYKEAVMFFFSEGNGLDSVTNVHQIKLCHEEIKASGFWRVSQLLNRLERFWGTLSPDGESVVVPVKFRNNTQTIKILTAIPQKNTSWFNKTVYFVIGFSWSGPKAYDVDRRNPKDEPLAADLHPSASTFDGPYGIHGSKADDDPSVAISSFHGSSANPCDESQTPHFTRALSCPGRSSSKGPARGKGQQRKGKSRNKKGERHN